MSDDKPCPFCGTMDDKHPRWCHVDIPAYARKPPSVRFKGQLDALGLDGVFEPDEVEK